MAPVYLLVCNKCGVVFGKGTPGGEYAVDHAGMRVWLSDMPGEKEVQQITGMSWPEAIRADRLGFQHHCVCLSCGVAFDLDLERDRKVCQTCQSLDVRSLVTAGGRPCPKCQAGTIESTMVAVT
jgi:hypothetical protein